MSDETNHPQPKQRSRPMTGISKDQSIKFVGIDLAKRSFHV
jgi:hypothetical protein